MAHSSAVRIITLAALAIGTSLFAQAQDSIIHEDLPVEADDTAITGGKICDVSKVRFENKGAYSLHWFAVDDYVLAKNMLLQGKSHT